MQHAAAGAASAAVIVNYKTELYDCAVRVGIARVRNARGRKRRRRRRRSEEVVN